MNNYFYLKAIKIQSTVRLIKPHSDIPNIKYSKD